MLRRTSWLWQAQQVSSLSHTNQWAAHISPRNTTKEMYSLLSAKGIIGQNTAQQSVLELCDGLLDFINNEQAFKEKIQQLEEEAIPKRKEEAEFKKYLFDARMINGGAANSDFQTDALHEDDSRLGMRSLDKTFETARLQAQKKAVKKWDELRKNYMDLVNKKKAERWVYESQQKEAEHLKKQREDYANGKFNGMGSTFTNFFKGSNGTKHGDGSSISVKFPELAGGPKNSMGLYLWGDVGIGKTMMMDLFEMCPTPGVEKRRCHLHSFVTDLHKRIHIIHMENQELRRLGKNLDHRKDPLEQVAEDIVSETRILCFDEFQTFDVANASLLANFFKHAFRLGIVLVATSNRPPEGLLRAGKGLARFVPELYDHCAVVNVAGVGVDYRLEKAAQGSCHDFVFSSPNTKESAHQLISFVGQGFTGDAKDKFLNGQWERDFPMSVYHRGFRVPRRLGGVAVFPFSHICGFGQMLGPADFQLLAKTFHHIIITDVPHIATTSKNGMKQFIILVDECYQHHVKLLLSAAVPFKKLLKASCVSTGEDERLYYTNEMDERIGGIDASEVDAMTEDDLFEFRSQEEVLSLDRVQSRLEEMGSIGYLTKDHLDFVVEDFDLSIYEKVTVQPLLQC